MNRIRNAAGLSRTDARADVLAIIESAFEAIDTGAAIRSRIKLDGDTLTINQEKFNLGEYEHIYIVGCGKVACEAASELEDILKDRIKDGAVIGVAKKVCDIIATYEGTHPRPSAANFDASAHMMRIGDVVTENDLVLAIVGGGGSALLCSSEGECDQAIALYDDFLPTGGTINELNVIRRHLSPLKGGGLAKALYPATVVGLIFSDVADGDLATVASGPTYMDSTTMADAQKIITKYGLDSYEMRETPKDSRFFEKVHNIPIVTNMFALDAMRQEAERRGYAVVIPSCDPYAAPADIIECLTAAAKPHSVVLFAGETRLSVPDGVTGSGGRNSTLALHALERLSDTQTFASFASDGHDNSQSAGAIVDSATRDMLTALDGGIEKYLANFDANGALKQTHDLIDTGHLASNVADLAILLTS